MDTRPFLFVDLFKSTSWREDLHPRDKYGRFTTVRGGSKIVTRQGRTGVVDKVTDTHYLFTSDDGKKLRIMKKNAIHFEDHKKATAKPKTRAQKRKATATAKKATKTRETNKANATGGAKKIQDPTAKAPKRATGVRTGSQVHTSTGRVGKVSGQSADGKRWLIDTDDGKKIRVLKENVTHANDVKKKAPKKQAPKKTAKKATPKKTAPKAKKEPIVKQAIPQKAKDPKQKDAQNQALKQEQTDHITLPKNKDVTIDAMWASPEVSKVMSQPAGKRDPEKIRQLAGEITEKNDLLARMVANRRMESMGLPHRYNTIGNNATPSDKVIKQETGLYGDMLQSARGSMYETLLATLSGAQNPGSEIGAHVVNRMKDKTRNDLYGFMNSIPTPHEMRPAIRDMKRSENELGQLLGRTPSDDELAQHMEQHSEHFRSASIPQTPKWDEKTNDWIAPRGKVEDPSERLALLKQYDAIQRTASADMNVGNDGENEVTISGNVEDENRTPDEIYERKERQKELEGALPKAMQAMGMNDASIKVWTLTHSDMSSKRNQAHLTGDEVAEIINAEGGWNGKPVSRSWVAKWYREGRKVLEQAIKDNHPAISQLSMLKSFVFNNMLRNVYEYNLIKSLYDFGMDETLITEKFVRTASGNSIFDIKKSLSPTEYIGSYVSTDEGYIHARIVEHDYPRGEELSKAMGAFEDLTKSMGKGKGNHAVNQKAGEYVKKNKARFQGMADQQMTRINQKKGQLTWSEQLQKEKGGVWITWSGKRILISGDGNIIFDSKNDSHRDEQAEKNEITNEEEKLEYQHEKEEAEESSQSLKEQALEAHKEGKYGRSKRKWAEEHGVKWDKKAKDFELDEDGNLQFDHEGMNFNTDFGAVAFEESLGDMKEHIREHKAPAVDALHQRAIGMYSQLSEGQQEALDKMDKEEREQFIGNFIADQDGVRDLMERAHQMASEGMKGADIHAELAEELKALGDATESMALKNKGKMVPVFNGMAKGDVESGIQHLGAQEISRAREEANKRIVPEGFYEIGNKQNGKSMVVKLGHRVDPESGNFTSYVQEAFDPETGKHFTTEDVDNSWGQLGKEIGLPNNSAEKFIYETNDKKYDAIIQAMDEEKAMELRKKTNLGMKDEMLHKDFKMVSQERDKKGNVVSTTYAQDMPDGTQNIIDVDKDGLISDPIMARLLKADKPIKSAEDLHDVMANAVGNRAWVTAHMGSDVHIGSALGHHVQLMYDGKGAPKVVGGAYDGHRFMDSKDLPKGAVDPDTGEPIKTLFRNGKLVGRSMSTTNQVPIAEGNPVMYKDGDRYRRGHIRSIQGNAHQVTDAKGNLIGMFDKSELKNATEKGRTLSKSGQAVVKLAHNGTHRMDTSKVFGDDSQSQKAKELFIEAVKKAKVNGIVNREGELNKNIELNDAQHQALQKAMGRSKASKAIMSQFETSKTPELELHVPEDLRAQVEAEGVAIARDGTARISTAKFEELRNIMGGLSLDHKSQEFMRDHFKRKDRTKKSPEELKKNYQPSVAEGQHADYFRKQFKEDSFLMNPEQGLYGTQLEGVSHLVERGHAIAGHGINSTLAMTYMLKLA